MLALHALLVFLQVYRAKLRETGEIVAVKVQRPRILETVSKDLYVLRRAAEVYQGLIDRFAPQQARGGGNGRDCLLTLACSRGDEISLQGGRRSRSPSERFPSPFSRAFRTRITSPCSTSGPSASTPSSTSSTRRPTRSR